MKRFSIWRFDRKGNLLLVTRSKKDEKNAESVLSHADQSREMLWKRIKQNIDDDNK